MEERQRLEIGARIKLLRERSPFKQQAMADKLGLGLRGYQKLEKNGTEDFERCETIYKLHKPWLDKDPEWAFVSPGWIWDGKERGADLSEAFAQAESSSQLDRIEAKLDRVLGRWELLEAEKAEAEVGSALDEGQEPRQGEASAD